MNSICKTFLSHLQTHINDSRFILSTMNVFIEPSHECTICAESYTKSVRSRIECPYCHYEACRKCCERYVLQEPFPKCMNPECGKEWTRLFVSHVFTKQFVATSLKQHRQDVLFEKEKALFPATQIAIQTEKTYLGQIRECDSQIADLHDQLDVVRTEKSRIYRHLAALLLHGPDAAEGSPPDSERRKFVRACPAEGCRGFLSTQWKCGICDLWTCPECHGLKGSERNDESHVCHPDDVATARLLDSDSKPCPNCASLIFKIDGCDQMWCIECKTGFSWRTGKIEQRVHNPHYFEWLNRTGGREEGGREDGRNDWCRPRDLGGQFVLDVRRRMRSFDVPREWFDKIMSVMESMTHLHAIVMPRFAQNDDPIVRRNLSLRMSYMKGDITETQLKDILQKENKHAEKSREIHEILDLVYRSSVDLLHRYYDDLFTTPMQDLSVVDKSSLVLREIDALLKYANECLTSISRAYACVHYSLRMRYEGRWAWNVLCHADQAREPGVGVGVGAREPVQESASEEMA